MKVDLARSWLLAAALSSVCACHFEARSPENYRKDTRALLETRNADLTACYDDALRNDPNLGGAVVIGFVVSARSGGVNDVKVLPQTTAPERLSECVRMALYGLVLQPPDDRDGEATFVWRFGRLET